MNFQEMILWTKVISKWYTIPVKSNEWSDSFLGTSTLESALEALRRKNPLYSSAFAGETVTECNQIFFIFVTIVHKYAIY